jgi:DNA-binding transcriptional regulator LsrR (DeoR family)
VKRSFDPATSLAYLTFEQKLTAAWAYHVKGVDQHTLASIYGVNQGRISEACKAAEHALSEMKVSRATPQES